MNKIEELKKLVSTAKAEGKILDSAVENIENWLSKNFLPNWAIDALYELFENQAYEELNDRFFKPLAFGTGGMRGRTIGKVSAKAEQHRYLYRLSVSFYFHGQSMQYS